MNLNQSSSTDAITSIARAAQRSADERSAVAPENPRTVGATLVVPVVVGTRPEAIKMLPVILALEASKSFKPVVVSTGQHHQMVKEIFDLAGIEIETNLWAGAQRADLNERVATVIQRFNDFISERFGGRPSDAEFEEAVLRGRYPATVLVHGDTSSAMAAALSATHMHIPVMHVEAGLRTGGSILSPFPEELNRQVITNLAAMHFAPTFSNLQALIREAVPVGQIFVTGNTGIDALHWAAALDSPLHRREAARADRVRRADRRRHRTPPRELGRGTGQHRLGDRPAGGTAPRDPLRDPAAPEPARARGARRAARRTNPTCC